MHAKPDSSGNLRIIVWSASDMNPYTIARFIKLGAEGHVSIRNNKRDLIRAFETMLAGGKCYTDEVEKILDSDYEPVYREKLSDRQSEILRYCAVELGNREIADLMNISPETVHSHKKVVSRICGGTRVRNYLPYAVKHGVLTMQEYEEYINACNN